MLSVCFAGGSRNKHGAKEQVTTPGSEQLKHFLTSAPLPGPDLCKRLQKSRLESEGGETPESCQIVQQLSSLPAGLTFPSMLAAAPLHSLPRTAHAAPSPLSPSALPTNVQTETSP